MPLVLLLITASTRYITHPAAFDLLSGGTGHLSWDTSTHIHGPHKRHPGDAVASVVTLSGSPSSSAALTLPTTVSGSASAAPTAATAQTVPSVPTNPDLPTPFPQAFDSDITQNYSSMTCFNFFSNMTNTAAFRSCRPFSILLQTSNAFVEVCWPFLVHPSMID